MKEISEENVMIDRKGVYDKKIYCDKRSSHDDGALTIHLLTPLGVVNRSKTQGAFHHGSFPQIRILLT